ncbi:thyroid transcription factor 1-associated protein 26-like [Monodelphis domestica]|uniref:thyroid transcription factor 1-associated protein 26-like n=1 Tax=Monodelphis domestica TaxID=13616 RepID=UPI0024E1FCFF|nr:thyroid transcription factor 1-associated protein 26-like [Monodelphis domestica]
MAPAKSSHVVQPQGAQMGGAQPQGGPAGSPEFKKKEKKKLQKQRMWRTNTQKAFSCSVHEGQGFAFQRKQKIQEYKKLLRKEKKAQIKQESQFTEKYPEHLKHLYLAEEEEILRKQDKKEKQPLPEEKSRVSMKYVFSLLCKSWKLNPGFVGYFDEALLPLQEEIRKKHQIRKQKKNMKRYKLSIQLRSRSLKKENKREKKHNSTIKKENGSIKNIEQKKNEKRTTKSELTNGVSSKENTRENLKHIFPLINIKK